jgi:ribosomal protein S18 acetylase RimI-like enzyme
MHDVHRVGAGEVEMLQAYAETPSYVEVTSILRCDPMADGMGGLCLSEHVVDPPVRKIYLNTEYDPFPTHDRWDVSQWGIFVATMQKAVVGGCVVALRTEEVHMLEGRKDMAVLWDIRVSPNCKRSGIGSTLFESARSYAAERGCRRLKIETQNVNVPACRFYRKQGCHLGGVNIHAYADFPDEVQLLWYLRL